MIDKIKLGGRSFNLSDINYIFQYKFGSMKGMLEIGVSPESNSSKLFIVKPAQKSLSPKEIGLTLVSNGIHNFASITQRGDLLVNLENVANADLNEDAHMSAIESSNPLNIYFKNDPEAVHSFGNPDRKDAEASLSALESAMAFYEDNFSSDCLSFDQQ